MNGEHLQVYRFAPESDGETAIPAALFFAETPLDKKNPGWPPHQPAKGEWIWRDANGNGAFDAGEYERRAGRRAPFPRLVGGRARQRLAGHGDDGHALFPGTGARRARQSALELRQDADVSAPGGVQAGQARALPAGDRHAVPRGHHRRTPEPALETERARSSRATTAGCMASANCAGQIVAPYADGSKGHSSCEPMGFDVAGDFVFVPYTGASKPDGVKHGRVEVFRAADGASIGHLEPSDDVGEIGLQDIRECLRAHRRADGEFVVFLEDDYKSKVVMYRWRPEPFQ